MQQREGSDAEGHDSVSGGWPLESRGCILELLEGTASRLRSLTGRCLAILIYFDSIAALKETMQRAVGI